MCFRVLFKSGQTILGWRGVEVYERQRDYSWRQINDWNPSDAVHPLYEVATVAGKGSYWVPASTNPPRSWIKVPLTGEPPADGPRSVNPNHNEFRPSGIYFWIPEVPANVTTFDLINVVDCTPPDSYPPVADIQRARSTVDISAINTAHDTLATILGEEPSKFQDSDGLISFVNLSSDFVSKNPEFKTGQTLCDMIANFYSTLRPNTFAALADGRIKPLKDDSKPQSQWDPAVTHYMQYLLQQAGGLTDYRITTESYTETQLLAEFSTDFLKLFFDAATVPSSVISGVTSFITGVGSSLRTSWDNKQRNYSVGLLGQCHEAVQENTDGTPVYRYFPKTKYYYLSISASQTEFTSPCVSTRTISFQFQYESYVSAIAADALDTTTDTYKQFHGFLARAQATNYRNAENQLDTILGGTVSTPVAKVDLFDVNISSYPLALGAPGGNQPIVRSASGTGHRLVPR